MYFIISVVLAIFILYDLFLMSSPKTAVKGNYIGAAAIVAAIIVTLYYYQIIGLSILWVCLLIGGGIGLYLGGKVKMIQMPEMVAFLHGLGGLAAVLLSITVLVNPEEITLFTLATGMLALVVGGLTFSGSMVAASKLHQIISSKPVVFPGHNTISVVTILFMLLAVVFSLIWSHYLIPLVVFGLVISLFFGYLFTIRVGGADMPITISLLNSCSGVTGAMVGMATYDPLLVAGGGIVASAGYLLTEIMCRAMNRGLLDVLAGKTTMIVKNGNVVNAPKAGNEGVKPKVEKPQDIKKPEKKTAKDILSEAKKIIIVPGYGMALAQAQVEVKQFADLMENRGKDVKYAIHPVAGRMPGHMNVLLAEVDVEYDKLFEMDAINPEFKDTDLVVIVGANDVVNPAANSAKDTPIYGMPILNAYEAKNVIICNFDTKPGYAGVENPLYAQQNVLMILGDAKETVGSLVKGAMESGTEAAAAKDDMTEMAMIADAEKVIIVPGYGMALAQAQAEVKKLADILQLQGKNVKYAIHPVAGRMPGHMNVLLAEVNVDYDQLFEMDAINPEFKETDLVVIVGANDVVNPAANTAKDTPIYGMPILNAYEGKKVIVFNFDTKPGYAGVENPLYQMSNSLLVLGDAKETVGNLVSRLL